jgi:hypothetical protein
MRKASKLSKTDKEIDTILETMPDFGEVFPETTTEDAQKLLDQTLEGGSTDSTEGTTKYAGKAEAETNDIDKAFDELLA